MTNRDSWTFSQYVYELDYLAEISEIPQAAAMIPVLRKEVKKKYPKECKEIGIA